MPYFTAGLSKTMTDTHESSIQFFDLNTTFMGSNVSPLLEKRIYYVSLLASHFEDCDLEKTSF